MPDDARISTALPTHPKTVKLERRLGKEGCWSLICLFLWVSNNRPTGDLSGMSTEDIEIAAHWSGDAGAFVNVLVQVRFIDGSEGSYSVHDWVEHNPWAANRPQRIEAAREAAKKRWADAKGMRGVCDPNQNAMPHSPLLSSPHHTTEKQKRNGANAPARPTLEEVAAYCKERNNDIDPEYFLDHYNSNGWKQNGGNKIVDWKATVRTWEKRNRNGVNGNGTQQSKSQLRLERQLAEVRSN